METLINKSSLLLSPWVTFHKDRPRGFPLSLWAAFLLLSPTASVTPHPGGPLLSHFTAEESRGREACRRSPGGSWTLPTLRAQGVDSNPPSGPGGHGGSGEEGEGWTPPGFWSTTRPLTPGKVLSRALEVAPPAPLERSPWHRADLCGGRWRPKRTLAFPGTWQRRVLTVQFSQESLRC